MPSATGPEGSGTGASPALCTVVIPVHDRAGLTRRCLDAILADPPRAAFEIVVVDDASTDSTPELIGSYGDRVSLVPLAANAGFAGACNAGAAAAGGEHLVFLNNDTVPLAGWLDALVEHAGRHPSAAIVGSRLLFPDDTVQHAGVVVCQDGRPRHLYAGFPADHPAVNRPRRLQAVTAACMLVRRTAFERVGGFDTAFRNSLEDADLCLRLGQEGQEVHYCPESVLYHLESASRGSPGSEEVERNSRLFAERWAAVAERDDLRHYAQDGLLQVGYRDSYPLQLAVAAELASVSGAGTGDARLLELQSQRAADLLREVVHLTARIAELELGAGQPHGRGDGEAERPPEAGTGSGEDLAAILADADRLESEAHRLQSRLAAACARAQREAGEEDAPAPGAPAPATPAAFAPGAALGYRQVKARIRALVEEHVPAGAEVLVVSRGDEELIALPRPAAHFPAGPGGDYAGHHPADGAAAVADLERRRRQGAAYLLIPATDRWWLSHYEELARHLRDTGEVVADDESCVIFRLGDRDPRTSGAA